jgi:predicted nucleic acid-binding protein
MTKNKQILIDTNILVYSNDTTEKNKHQLSKKFIKEIATNHEIVISTQNLAELSRIITEKVSNPINHNLAKKLVENYSTAFKTITYSEKTIIKALTIKNEFQIHFWDALIAATMEENNIETIITENEKDFKKVKWLNLINPFKK